MRRRRLMALAATGGVGGLAGCSERIHETRGANTPLSVRVRADATTVAHVITRDGETAFDGEATFSESGTVQSVEGDDFRDAAFTEAGSYRVCVDIGDTDGCQEFDFTWRELADCNTNTLGIVVEDEEIEMWVERTTADCDGLDRL